jgi:hypothetical protein
MAVGFRFSTVDGCVLVVGAIASAVLAYAVGTMALIVVVPLVHFFLFCNVFRVRRWLELWWTATFVLNAGAWFVLAGEVSWLAILAVQLPITVAVIAWQMRQPDYHGVFARARPNQSASR